MARKRYLHPSFFTDEKITDLPLQHRLFFQGLWCLADRAGRLEYRPKFFKASIFPYENFNIVKMLDALKDAGFIFFYEVDQKKYVQIINFEKFQTPHKDEPIQFPEPQKILEKQETKLSDVNCDKSIVQEIKIKNNNKNNDLQNLSTENRSACIENHDASTENLGAQALFNSYSYFNLNLNSNLVLVPIGTTILSADIESPTQPTVLEYYQDKYTDKTKKMALIDDKIVSKSQTLVKTYKRDGVIQLIDKFFYSNDQWILKSDYSFHAFYSQVPKLLLARDDPSSSILEEWTRVFNEPLNELEGAYNAK